MTDPRLGAGPWPPPPQPGLIPLRPLALGDILGGAFRLFFRNPRTTLGTSLLFNLGSFVVSAAVVIGVAIVAILTVLATPVQDRASLFPLVVLVGFAVLLVPIALAIAVQAVLPAVFILETSHQILGEKMRLGGLLRQARGRIWALVGWLLLLAAAGVVAVGVLAGIVITLVVAGGHVGVVIGILLGFAGFVGFFVAAVWIGTKTALVPSILLLERVPLGQAVARSWYLTRLNFWRVFGIIALVAIIVSTAANVVSAPVSFLTQLSGGFLQPGGTQFEHGFDVGSFLPFVLLALVGNLVTVLITAIGSIIQSATVALLYVDLRIRWERLDLQLLQYVTLRNDGVTPLPDPYRAPPTQAEK